MWLYIAVLLFVFFIFKNYWKNLPPGPSGFSFMRNVSFSDISNRIRYFRKLRQQYGDVFCFTLFGSNFVIVNGPEALKEIFVKNGHLSSDRPYCFLTILSRGFGLIGSSGHIWKEQRTFALATLRSFGFGKRSLEVQIREVVNDFVSYIDDTRGEPFDIHHVLTCSMANVICSLAFGQRMDKNDKRFMRLLEHVNGEFESPKSRILNYFPFLEHLPGDSVGLISIDKKTAAVKKILLDIIEEHRKTFNPENIRDYIDMYLLSQKQQQDDVNSTFTERQLRQSVNDIFVAGTETTATTIRWMVLFLILNQDVQDKMRAEIDNIVERSEFPSLEHKPKLPYCEAVIAETLRLGTIVPLSFPHDLKENIEYKGFTIPKGSILIPNIDSVASDPELFPNPTKFDPTRFLSETGEFCGQNKIFPFSLGRRVCLGESLARMEIFLFTTCLVQRFQLLPENPNSLPTIQGVQGITYSPQPFKLKAIQRK